MNIINIINNNDDIYREVIIMNYKLKDGGYEYIDIKYMIHLPSRNYFHKTEVDFFV